MKNFLRSVNDILEPINGCTVILTVCIILAGCQPLHAQNNSKVAEEHLNQVFTFNKDCCESYRGVVFEKLNSKDVVNAKEISENLEIGFIEYDLNNDDLTDFFAQVYSPLHCGTAGCSLYIFLQKSDGTFTELVGPSNTYWKIVVSQKLSNGMHDLIFQGKQEEACLWKWHAGKYEFQDCK